MRGTDNVGRRLSKIIRSEARAEKVSLDVALGELAELQKLQKVYVKVPYHAPPPKKNETIRLDRLTCVFWSSFSN